MRYRTRLGGSKKQTEIGVARRIFKIFRFFVASVLCKIALAVSRRSLRQIFSCADRLSIGYVCLIHGLWLSLVERCVRDAEAAGSNPASPTIQGIFRNIEAGPVLCFRDHYMNLPKSPFIEAIFIGSEPYPSDSLGLLWWTLRISGSRFILF